jgi:hypothetical protein
VVVPLLDKVHPTHQETGFLRVLLASSETVSRARELVLEFERLVGGRRADDLAGWMSRALQSQIPELATFVRGL